MDWLTIDNINLLRASLAIALMTAASTMDLKNRRVSDTVWIVMGVVGLIFLEAQIYILSLPFIYNLLIIPIVIIFADVFIDRAPLWDSRKGDLNTPWLFIFTLAGIMLVYLLWQYRTDVDFLALYTVPVMMLVSYLLYYTNILHGGADAKALLSISIMFPLYPQFGNLPLWDIRALGDIATVLLPFSLTMLMNAAIISIFVPLGFALYNISRHDLRAPAMFFGYRVLLKDADARKMWLMEKIRHGELTIRCMPERETYDDDMNNNEDDDNNSEMEGAIDKKQQRNDGLEGEGSPDDKGDSDDDSEEKEDDIDDDGNEDELSEEEIDRLEEERFKNEVDALREYGLEKVWVTPKLPFILFMAIGLAISLFLGNLLLGLVAWIFNVV